MNSDKDFILLKKINSFNDYVNDYIVSLIPNVRRNIRIHLLDEIYNLQKYLYEAIYNKGNIRSKYINEMVISISLIDNLFRSILKYNKPNEKHIIRGIGLLTDIKNMTFAWRSNIEKESR